MEHFEKLIKSQPIWTLEDIGKMSKLSTSFIRSEIRAGRLRRLTAGRRVLVICDDLLAYFLRRLALSPRAEGEEEVDQH